MVPRVRFNDLMQTVLAAEDRSGIGAVTLWRQCVDLLAQHDRYDRSAIGPIERSALLERLGSLRQKLSETQRIATVVELGSRLRSVTLVEFFAGDRPSIAAAAMARAQLPDALWADMVPRLTPTARGVLRGRHDMGPQTRQALEAFGPADLVLTSALAVDAASDDMLLTPDMMLAPEIETLGEPEAPATPQPRAAEPSQIRTLVDRIERFTSARQLGAVSEAPSRPRPDETMVPSFAFETDAEGVIIWVDQGPRAALVGLSLAQMPLDGGSGPDGHVAGAFARRSGFRNGRFAIVGGAVAGDWRFSATPFFDPRSGRFQGYRGQARRPHLHEVAAEPDQGPHLLSGLSADSLRQLVHELRTPLNAILGFAEIIEQELFGPSGPEYRDMAGNIARDARHLLSAFDDLDLAAKVSRGDSPNLPRLLDPSLLVSQVTARFRDQMNGKNSRIEIDMARDLPPVRIDPVQGERMIQHLLRTLISVSPEGELLTGVCRFQGSGTEGRVVLAIDRPTSLAGMEEAQLLDPGYTPEGDWADGPLLGLGFSLRLIRSLAAGSGGSLTIEAGRFLLAIPAALRSGDSASQA